MTCARPARKAFGAEGEAVAANYLQQQGYRILARNFRPPAKIWRGEIDIVAADGRTVCFVEVKTRHAGSGDPAESVTRAKQRQITSLAEAYLALANIPPDTPCRFDVIAVVPDPYSDNLSIRHYKNAFWPD